jgi:hypothetical protein
MQRSTKIVASTFILVLGGCGSFNNSFNTYSFPLGHTENIPPQHAEHEPIDPNGIVISPPQQITVEVSRPPCGALPYVPPDAPPELPNKALAAANGDVYAIERIERRHIDELRAYISEWKRQNRAARENFNIRCDVVSKE